MYIDFGYFVRTTLGFDRSQIHYDEATLQARQQGADFRPYAVIRDLTHSTDFQFGGDATVQIFRYQVILVHRTPVEADPLIRQLRDTFDGYVGRVGRWHAHNIQQGNAFTRLIGEENVYQIQQNFDITCTALSQQTAIVPGAEDPIVMAPLNFVATAGVRQIALSWERPIDLQVGARTIIRQGANFANGTEIYNSGSDATSFVVTNLIPNTYQFHMAFQFSDVLSDVVSASSSAQHPPLQAPQDFTAAVDERQVTLSWQRPTGTFETRISRDGTVIYNSAGTATTFVDTDLTRTQTYTYTIRFVRGADMGPESMQTVTIPQVTVPAPALLMTSVSGTSITLTWERPDALASTATIVIEQDDTEIFRNADDSIETHTINDLTEGTTYTFEVFFIDEGITGPSATAMARIPFSAPMAVTNFRALVVTTQAETVQLTWTPPADAVEESRVVIRRGPDFATATQVFATEDERDTIEIFTDLPIGSTQQFWIYYETEGAQGPETGLSVVVNIPPPRNFAVSIDDYHVVMNWERPRNLPANIGTRIIRFRGTTLPRITIYESTSDATSFRWQPDISSPIFIIEFYDTNGIAAISRPVFDLVTHTPPDSVPPPPVLNPTAVASVPRNSRTNNDDIVFTWENPTGGITASVVEISYVDGRPTGQEGRTADVLTLGTPPRTAARMAGLAGDDLEGQTVQVQIRTGDSAGHFSLPIVIDVPVPLYDPSIPRDLQVTYIGTTIRLAWILPIEGAGDQSSYILQRDGVVISTMPIQDRSAGMGVSYDDTGRTPGVQHVYSVHYRENDRDGPAATITAAIPFTAPEPLATFTATAVGGSVLLQWTRGDDDAAVVITRAGNVVATITDPSVLQFTETNLVEGETYTYAAIHRENGLDSTAISASATIPFSPPSDPLTFTATAEGAAIRFDWTSADLPANTQAIIRQGNVFATATQIHSGAASTGTFMPTTVFIRGQTYTFYIFFRVNGLDSGHRVATAFVPHASPAAPTDLTAVASGNNRITLMWTRPASVSANAFIEIRRGTTTLEEFGDETSGITTYMDTVNYDNNEGQTFTYSVAYRENNLNSAVTTASVTIPTTDPAPVSDFSAAASGTNVVLTWSRPTGAGAQSTYTIRRGGTAIRSNIGDGSTTFTDTNRPRGVAQSYTIAYTEDGVTAAVATAQITIPFLTPGAPVNLAAAVSDDDVILTWQRPQGTTAAVTAEIRRGGVVIAPSVTGLTYSDVGLDRGSSYTYSVRLTENGLTGPAATVTSAVIPHTAPTPPANVQVAVNDDDVTITWARSTGATTAARAIITRGGTQIADDLAGLTYTDNNVQRGVAHTYTIRFTENGLESTAVSVTTPVIAFLPPPAPTAFLATPSGRTITLSWNRPSSLPAGATTIINRGATNVYTSTTSATSFTETVEWGTSYTYTIIFQANGLDSDEATDTAATGVPTPNAITATLTGQQVALAWTNPEGLPAGTIINIARPNGASAVSSPTLITTFSDSQTLPRGADYTWQIRYRIGTVNGDFRSSNTITVPHIAPLAPVNLAAAVDGDDVTLSWERPAGTTAAATATITRGGTQIATGITVLTYVDSDLDNGDYTYTVSFTENALTGPTASVMATVNVVPTGLPAPFAFGVRRITNANIRDLGFILPDSVPVGDGYVYTYSVRIAGNSNNLSRINEVTLPTGHRSVNPFNIGPVPFNNDDSEIVTGPVDYEAFYTQNGVMSEIFNFRLFWDNTIPQPTESISVVFPTYNANGFPIFRWPTPELPNSTTVAIGSVPEILSASPLNSYRRIFVLPPGETTEFTYDEDILFEIPLDIHPLSLEIGGTLVDREIFEHHNTHGTSFIPPVRNLISTLNDDDDAVLNWQSPPNLTPSNFQINVFRDDTQIGTALPVTTTTFTDTNTTEGQTHTYEIQILQVVPEGGFPIGSQRISTTITVPTMPVAPLAPVNLVATLGDFVASVGYNIILTWDLPPDTPAGTTARVRTTSTNLDVDGITETTYTSAGHELGTVTFNVSLINNGLEGPAATAFLLVPLTPPTDFAAAIIGNDRIQLSWSVSNIINGVPINDATSVFLRLRKNLGAITTTIRSGTLFSFGTSHTDFVEYNGRAGVVVTYTIEAQLGSAASETVTTTVTIPAISYGPVTVGSFPSAGRSVLASGVRLVTDTTRPRNQGGMFTPSSWALGNLIGAQFRNNSAQTHFLMVSTDNPAASPLFNGTYNVRITMIPGRSSSSGEPINEYYIQGSTFTFQSGDRVHEVVMASSTINVNGTDTDLPTAIGMMRSHPWGANSEVIVEVIP